MEIAKLILDIVTCVILGFTLCAVLRYTRSTIKLQKESEKQTKAIIDQTDIGFQQTKAVIEQAKLIKRQMVLSILPAFQMGVKEKDKEIHLSIRNIGQGVALNIQVLVRFDNSDNENGFFLIPILEPKKNSPETGILSIKEACVKFKTTFIFNDLLGNIYIQVIETTKLVKQEIFFYQHGFVETLTKERAVKELKDYPIKK